LKVLQTAFATLDKDKSGEISAAELANNKFDGISFSLATTHLLVKVFDKDRSGQISFFEFASLNQFVTSMKAAFNNFDRDRSGSIELNEVAQAVAQGGFHLQPQTLQAVYTKFLRLHPLNQGNRQVARGLNLELFIQLCAYLGSSRGTFSQFDYQRTGWITVNLDQYVLMGL
jgi:hypothetical protein